MDWVQAKIEYITNPHETYRSLAERYGVSLQCFKQRGCEEHWGQLRREHAGNICEKTVAAIASQTVDAITQNRMDRMQQVQSAAESLLAKLEEGISQADSQMLIRNAALSKSLTAAIRDIKEILELRTDADVREQEARIERLRRDAESTRAETLKLVIEGGEEDWLQ